MKQFWKVPGWRLTELIKSGFGLFPLPLESFPTVPVKYCVVIAGLGFFIYPTESFKIPIIVLVLTNLVAITLFPYT
jgi:hypothetical protein